MITKILNVTKCVIVITVFLIGLMACEKDFKDIGIALVDNNKFETKSLISEIIAYNKKIDSVRVDSLPQYVLGVNKSNAFGKTHASIASQIALPPNGVDFGENPTIDSVILDIPYYSTQISKLKVEDPRSENDSIIVPVFELDSIIGNQSISFQITVSELAVFLNDLDPLDPTRRKFYYSNRSYNTVSPVLFSGLFKPNANDTAAYIKRRDLNGEVYDIDTIKRVGAIPSIKLPLDENFFQNNFIEQSNSSVFLSFDEFNHFFRGIYISTSGTDGSLLTLPILNASISIFYTNDVTATDANDVTTITRTKQTAILPLSGIRTNKYEHDYSLATSSIQTRLLNPDKINGEQKLYLQGASGSMILLDLFTKDNLEDIRSKNWLINEANIKLFVDRNESSNDLPNRLFIFNADDNSHLVDILSEGQTIFDGTLHFNDGGEPDFYKFRITNHIAKILTPNNPIATSKLGIRVFSPFDIPNFLRLSDTIIKPFNWNPKGVVVYGNKELSGKRLSLEIFFTELKN